MPGTKKRPEDRDKREDEENEADGLGEEDGRIAFGENEASTEIRFHHRAEDDADHNRSLGDPELTEYITDAPEDEHDQDIEECIVDSIGTNDAEHENERCKNISWQGHNLGEHPDPCEAHHEHHDIDEEQTHEHRIDNHRMINEQERTRLQSFHQEHTEEHRGSHIPWHTKSEQRDEGPSGDTIVGGLRSSYTFDNTSAE